MTAHSDDILGRVGFLRSDVMPLLAAAGIRLDDTYPVRTEEALRKVWPDWKLRLAAADYLTVLEAASALMDLDPCAPGYISNEAEAGLSHWKELIKRACGHGSLEAQVSDRHDDGNPSDWIIAHRALAEWCASKNPPIPYPLPGDPTATWPTTDADLREALVASQRERATQETKVKGLLEELQQCSDLRKEIGQLCDELKTKADEVAALTEERDKLKADAIAGKTRTTALKIIGGMAMACYGMDIHADRLAGIGEVVRDLQMVGVDITEKTLRERLKDAAQFIDRNSKAK